MAPMRHADPCQPSGASVRHVDPRGSAASGFAAWPSPIAKHILEFHPGDLAVAVDVELLKHVKGSVAAGSLQQGLQLVVTLRRPTFGQVCDA